MSPVVKAICPVCKEEINAFISEEKIKNVAQFPLTVTVVHGTPPHSVILYVDEDLRVRAVEKSEITITTEGGKEIEIDYLPVPFDHPVNTKKLSEEEKLILSYCDGKSTVSEISEKVGKSFAYVRLTCLKLQREGKLKALKKVIRGE